MKVLFCYKMPKKEYVGGVASILKQYLSNKAFFEKEGISVSLFSYRNSFIDFLCKIKIGHFFDILSQRIQLTKQLTDDSTIIHIHTSRKLLFYKDLLLAKYLKKKKKNKIVLTIHFADFDKIFFNGFIRKTEIKVLNNYVDRIILLSEKTKKEFINHGIDGKKLSVMYTFHNYSNKSFRKEQHNGFVNLMFMGSIDKRKGILDLLKVFKSIDNPKVRLHVCGTICDKSIKKDFLDYLEILKDRVVFHGYVTGLEKEKLLEECDIFILPSYGEGMPIVIMEAMACGCSIISTRVGAIPEIVSNKNGFLFNPGDLLNMEKGINERLNNKDLLKAEQKQNIEDSIGFSLRQNIKGLVDLYKGM